MTALVLERAPAEPFRQADGDYCQAEVGPYIPDTRASLENADRCPAPAEITLRAACGCGHRREKRLCRPHADPDPAGAVWLCRACAESGHECRLRIDATEAGR